MLFSHRIFQDSDISHAHIFPSFLLLTSVTALHSLRGKGAMRSNDCSTNDFSSCPHVYFHFLSPLSLFSYLLHIRFFTFMRKPSFMILQTVRVWKHIGTWRTRTLHRIKFVVVSWIMTHFYTNFF